MQPSAESGISFLLWRLPVLLATILLVALSAHSGSWAFALLFPLTAGMAASLMFAPHVLERWLARGFLLLADASLVTLALLGVGRLPAALFVGFFGIVLVASLAADRRKTILAGAALIAAMAALPALGSAATTSLGALPLSHVLFLLGAAVSFGTLAERMSSQTEAVALARKETRELRTLLEISDTIGSTLDVGQVMRSIVQQVGDLMETESCSILLADDKRQTCFVVASKGHPDVDMLELDLSDYPEVRKALETREPVVIGDVETHPLVSEVREILLEKGYRSLLVVPLLFGKEVLGTLWLRARREKPYAPEELRFCKVAAGASANALKNALLYRDVALESENHRATGEKLRSVLDGTPDMIVASDLEGFITEFNRGAETLSGWGAREAIGRTLPELFGSGGSPLPVADEQGNLGPQDVVLRRADGERVQLSLAGAPLSGAEGDRAGTVWIGRDMTKLRRVEKSLIQAERLSSLGEVVAGVAHELNNPLSGVLGYAELLRKSIPDPELLRDLDRIVESAERCERIVVKLLSFARKQPTEKKYLDLNGCVNKVLDLKSYHLRSSQIETLLELDPELPHTAFDAYQIEQVILNLLNNADQAINSIKSPGRIVMRTGVRDGFVFIEVEDDGPGVPRAIRERVFDPFFTTKEVGQGTGLGLSVSFGIVREHGGRIELNPVSAEGGTRFTVYLPIVDGPAAAETAAEPEIELDERPLRGCRILVAEDEPTVLELFSRVLSADGAEVTLARDGEEAWTQLEQQEFDVIVTDLRMPRLSGQELYAKVAEQRPDLLRRFVFATGDLVRQETRAFLQGLPNRILAKPLEIETVRRVLSQAVESHPN